MTLNEAIKIILQEFIIKKEQLGDGATKVVYPLQTNPNYVVKQILPPSEYIRSTRKEWVRKILEPEVKFYENYPNLFAKIVKVNYEKGYMIQEKLDVKLFETNIKKLIKDLRKIKKIKFYEDQDEFLYVREFIMRYLDLIEDIYEGKNDFINKLINFFYATGNVFSTSTIISDIDFKTNNIGFDSSGNIKLLDI